MRKLPISVLLVCALATVAQAVEIPPQIATMYEDFHRALASGDMASVQGFLTQIALLQATIAAQGQRDHILRLPGLYRIQSLTPTFTSCTVKGDRALVGYDLKLVGTERKSGAAKTLSWHLEDHLVRGRSGWLINGNSRTDPELCKQQVSQGHFRSPDRGVELAIPEGWIPSVPVGGPGVVLSLLSPDLLSGAAVIVADLPVKIAAKAVVEADQKVAAALGLNSRVLSQGDTTLAGAPAYQMTTRIATPEITLYSQSIFRVDSRPAGDVLYALLFSSEKGEPATQMKAEADLIESSLKLTGPKVQPLPPELGKIAGGKYINDKYGVTMTLAEGWKARISKSRFLFQLSLAAPQGDSTLLLAALDVGQVIDPKLAAQTDLQTLRQVDPAVKVLGEGPRDFGGLSGYQYLLQFTVPGGGARTRWAAYIMRGKMLYFIVGDAVPATDYDKVKDDWGQMVNSIAWTGEQG